MKTRLLFIILLSVSWSIPLFAQSPVNIVFRADEIGKFPSGWISTDNNNAQKVYSVQEEGKKVFIHADSKGPWVQIGYEKKWTLKEFPILQWKWRAVLFPTGTNEREKNKNDSVLGLYVVFGHFPFVRTIKYIWSDTLPVGATFNSPFAKNTKIIVVQSGRRLMGTWVQESRDVLSDFQQLYGEGEKNPMATGIAILTDSDNTNSHAIGDYSDIQAVNKGEEKLNRP
jgi:hypothetical protein